MNMENLKTTSVGLLPWVNFRNRSVVPNSRLISINRFDM